MTFQEYQTSVMRTWNNEQPLKEQLDNAIYGVVGELGELIELYKKRRFHGIELDLNSEIKEMGDLLYYVTALMDVRGYSLAAIAENNRDKLMKRYPDGFVTGGGVR